MTFSTVNFEASGRFTINLAFRQAREKTEALHFSIHLGGEARFNETLGKKIFTSIVVNYVEFKEVVTVTVLATLDLLN